MAMTPAKAICPKDSDDSEGITVAIRMRPLNNAEDSQGRIWKVLPKYSSVAQTTRDGKPLSERVTGRTFFTFDKTFGEDTNNRQVYDSVAKGIVGSVVQGLNGTIFAYGQTSSGKTYTMQGSGNLEQGSAGNSEGGLVHMAAKDIFSQIVNQPDRMFLVRVSFLEIYNEEVRDLLAESNQKVQIREDPRRGVFVQSEEEIVTDFDSLVSILVRGDKSRTFAATGMNERSSRSHTILRITIESREKEQQNESEHDNKRDSISTSDGAVRVSTLNLVDLAGSESVRHTGATGERQKEGGLINQSLLTLSRVIVALGTPNQMHINFRDSKLTRILQPSLSGNARMAVICCATPSELYLEETRSTLQFASRAKLVKTNAQVNEVLDERSMIRRLQRELAEAKRNQTGADDKQVRDLEKQVETAGTQAMEAKAKLDRLKSSILNAGYLFDHPSDEANKTQALGSICVSKKRRKSEGPLLIGHKTPSKGSKHDIPTPNTAPRRKKIMTLSRPTLPAEKELELVQKALASRNQFVRELNSTIAQYTEQVREKNYEVERVMAEKSSLNQQKSEVHAEVVKLREIISSMQATLEMTVEENEKRTFEKEAELAGAFEKLQQSLSERNSLEEQLSEIRTRFEEVQEERVRGAFELAQMTTEKENLSVERADDKQKLQDMAGKTEFLTSNLNEATRERDDALAEIDQLRKEIEAARRQNKELRNTQDTKIAELESQIEGMRRKNGELSGENIALESRLDSANQEISSLTNQVSTLETTLEDLVDSSNAERKSLETKLVEVAGQIETLSAEKEAGDSSISTLTSQLNALKDELELHLDQNEQKCGEINDMKARIETLDIERNELIQVTERLEAENKETSEANNKLSLEKQKLLEKVSLLEGQVAASNAEIESYKANVLGLEQSSQELQLKIETTEAERKQLDERYRNSSLETENRIESLQADLSELETDLATTQLQKVELLSKVAEQQTTLHDLETTLNQLKDSFSVLEAEKIKTDEELQSATNRLQSMSDEKDIVVAEKNSLGALLTNYQQNVAEMEDVLAAAEGQISRLQKEKDAAFAASSQSLQKIQKFAGDLQLEKNRVTELERAYSELQTQCEERRSTIETINTASEELQRKIDMLVTERDSLKASLCESETNLSMLVSELQNKDTRIEELKGVNEKMTEQLQILTNDIHVRDTEIETLTSTQRHSSLEAKELASRHEALQERLSELTTERNDLCETISTLQDKLGKSKIEMEELVVELSSIRASHDKAQKEETNDEIIALQDQVDAVWREAQSLESRKEELEDLHAHVQENLERTQSTLEETRRELDEALYTRETLVQNLRDCEAERDEATSEVHDLFEKNRQLKELLSLSLPKEKAEQLSTELSEAMTQNIELQQLLASVNESEACLRNKVMELEEDLQVAERALNDAKAQVLQQKEDMSLVKHEKEKANHSQLDESQSSVFQRLEELVNEKKELEHKLAEEKAAWKAREAEIQKQMGEEQRALIQEGECLMADLRSKLQDCEARLSQAESEAYTARQQVEEISDERKNLEERYLEAFGQLSSLESANTSLKFQITKLSSELGAAKSECYKLKESSIEMKEKMRKSTRDSEKAIRDNEMASKEMASLRKKVSNLERQIDSDQAEIARLNKRYQHMGKESKQIDSLKDDLKKNETLIINLKKEISVLKLEKNAVLEEMKAKIESGSREQRKENDHRVVKLEEENQQLKEERKKNQERIRKLESTKLTKEKTRSIKEMKAENIKLKKQCTALEAENARLKSNGSSSDADVELRTEVSALRMDKECLEKKVRKFAMHCQRLEDDKAGMKDALRSCNIEVDGHENDLSDAVIWLCDRLASVEETHAQHLDSLKKRDVSFQKEKQQLHLEKEKLVEKLESSQLKIEELQKSIQERVGNSKETACLQKRVGELEQENLQLMQDLKAIRNEYRKTKMELDNIRANDPEDPTIDFAVMGARSSSVPTITKSKKTTRSSVARDQSQSFDLSSTDTMELTEMALRFAGNQSSAPSRKMASAKKSATKKRLALSESTNQAGPEGTREDSTSTKRQRREVTRSSREEREKRRTPGLGESSCTGGSASSENPAECNQQ